MTDYSNRRLLSELNRIAAVSKAEYEDAQARLEYYRSIPDDSPMQKAFNVLAGMIEKREKRSYLPDAYWELLAEAKRRGLVKRKESDETDR